MFISQNALHKSKGFNKQLSKSLAWIRIQHHGSPVDMDYSLPSKKSLGRANRPASAAQRGFFLRPICGGDKWVSMYQMRPRAYPVSI